MERAPFYTDEAPPGPEGGRAFWLDTRDRVRIRAACWSNADTMRGTVLCFPGRTEYVEKYTGPAAVFAQAGLASLAVDWRGQGLADRLHADHLLGHVPRFQDYQKDVAALCALAEAEDLPRPWFVLGHSMGGAIALRAVLEGLPVAAAVFSAPMFSIQMTPALRAVAWSLTWGSRQLGLDDNYAPSTGREPYVLTTTLAENRLSSDETLFGFMQDMLRAHPDLGLGGPSLRWLHEALKECRMLMEARAPDLPAMTFAGSEEAIVDLDAMRARMESWPGGTFRLIQDARHEVLLEAPEYRDAAFSAILNHFDQARLTPPGAPVGAASQGT
ncbi:MAG: alpha/beta hydrolase [Pseudomonadota bacterium]